MPAYDAILIVSFGGPEEREDVIPFLENVLRGKPVPPERISEVAEHYYHFDGRSPINMQVRQLKASLDAILAEKGPLLPIYVGNRNWHPLLADTVRQMATDGVRRALAFATSAWSSYSSCRQYLENIEQARLAVGPSAPAIDKIRPFFDHPGFVEAAADRVGDALNQIPEQFRPLTELIFTAHSIPLSMANTSRYEAQLHEASALVVQRLGHSRWSLVFQSRSGPPSQPWLEPDVNDYLRRIAASGPPPAVVLVPIGFLSDHLEVLWDLDIDARATCDRLGLKMVRAATVGSHPLFVAGVHDLICERYYDQPNRASLSTLGPCPDVCPPNCCPPPGRAK
jgi:ferrochelatase